MLYSANKPDSISSFRQPITIITIYKQQEVTNKQKLFMINQLKITLPAK